MTASAETVLVVGVSARALARSARATGMGVRAIDLFADRDTRRLCDACARVRSDGRGPALRSLLRAADRLDPLGTAGVVYGAGFEAAPERLAALCRGRELLGNAPEVITRLKDPERLAALLAGLGIPHPEIRRDAPPARGGWLVKRAGAWGGGHVRTCAPGAPLGRREYVQRAVAGRSLSATVLADGRRARVLGYCELWQAEATPGRPFAYAGAVTVAGAALPRGLCGALRDAIETLVAHTGLRGLFGVDLVAEDGATWWLLEVNPRPGATFELHERGSGLVGHHVAAVRGCLPEGGEAATPGRCRAHGIVYARAALRVPAGLRWPRWVSDLPRAGISIAPGEPVCTVHAQGADAREVRARVGARRAALEAWFGRWSPAQARRTSLGQAADDAPPAIGAAPGSHG